MPASSSYNIMMARSRSDGLIAHWAGDGRVYFDQGGLDVAAGEKALHVIGFC